MKQLVRTLFVVMFAAVLFGCPPKPDVEPPQPTDPLDPKVTEGSEATARSSEETP